MQQIKKTHAEGFYIFESTAAANSNYIEQISDAKMLLVYANFYLKDYLTIYDYIITKDGWQMAVKLKSRNEILAHQDIDSEEKLEVKEIWRIISEQIRLFISCYARQVNFLRGRSGSFVENSYKRYYFQSLKEAKQHLSKIRKQLICMYQRKPKYRGLKSHYEISNKMGSGSVFLCSKELYEGNSAKRNEIELSIFAGLEDLVLPEMINSTLSLHSTKRKPDKHPQ